MNGNSEHTCENCSNFTSWYDYMGDDDEYEPKDSGLCTERGYAECWNDACEYFSPINGDKE